MTGIVYVLVIRHEERCSGCHGEDPDQGSQQRRPGREAESYTRPVPGKTRGTVKPR